MPGRNADLLFSQINFAATTYGFHGLIVLVGGNSDIDSLKSMSRFHETSAAEGVCGLIPSSC